MIKIIAKSPRKERLTIEQVAKIHDLEIKLFPYQELYRDIFLYSMFTGLPFHEAISLKWTNVQLKNA